MKKQLAKMNSKLILFALFLIFVSGCANIDNHQRIEGIVDAVYTNYEQKKDFDSVKVYLNEKVENKEISSLTSCIVEKCLKRSFKVK